MPLSNADRQRRHRERIRQQIENVGGLVSDRDPREMTSHEIVEEVSELEPRLYATPLHRRIEAILEELERRSEEAVKQYGGPRIIATWEDIIGPYQDPQDPLDPQDPSGGVDLKSLAMATGVSAKFLKGLRWHRWRETLSARNKILYAIGAEQWRLAHEKRQQK